MCDGGRGTGYAFLLPHRIFLGHGNRILAYANAAKNFFGERANTGFRWTAQTGAALRRLVQPCADWCGPAQTGAALRGLVRHCADWCGPARTGAALVIGFPIGKPMIPVSGIHCMR